MPEPEPEFDDNERTNTLLYVLFFLYFVSLVGVAVVAYGKKQAAVAAGADISAQFGGSFGAPLLVLTTFSTVFSGYTVSGVPADAERRGYESLRWVTCVLSIVAGMLLYNPRLRRLGVTRGYMTPLDFITDRFRSKVFRLLCGICMCVPQILYLTVQFVSFAGVVGGVLGMTDRTPLMVFFGFLVLMMEFLGGMNSVVLTDAVQSVIMVAAFLVVPFVIWYHYGGLSSFAEAGCDGRHYVNSWAPNIHTAPLEVTWDHPNATVSGCLGDTVPDKLLYPAIGKGFFFFFFNFNQISFALNPHMVQRVSIARTDGGLRIVATVLLLSAFLTMLPGIYMGLMKQAYAPSWPENSRNMNTFASVAEELMKKGPFEQLLMSIMMCSGMAAVMSSADSVMMGVSSTVAVDLVQGILKPAHDISDSTAVHIGEAVSVVQVIIAILAGRPVHTNQFPTMLTLQAGILAQVVPAFILGMRTQVSVRAVTAGISTGLFLTFIFFLGSIEWIPYMNGFGPRDGTEWVPYPTVALAANVTVLAITQFLAPGFDTFVGEHYDDLCKRYGGGLLTMKDIEKAMKGMTDVPILVPLAMLTLSLAASPIWGTPGASVPLIMGWPSWAFNALILCIIATGVGLFGIYIWDPPPEAKPDPTENSVEMADNSVELSNNFGVD